MNKLFLLICTIMLCVQMQAQEKLHYWNDSDAYLQDQATLIFEQAYKIFAAYPPDVTVGDERKMALYALDALLHDTRIDHGTAFISYLERITGNIAVELQKSKPSGREIRFFRCYNDGFIIKTATVTVGIDLVRGGTADKPFIGKSVIRTLVDQCDILFISHGHGDHTDPVVIDMFLEQGKKVIVPEDFKKDTSPRLHVLRGTQPIRETISIPAKNTGLLQDVRNDGSRKDASLSVFAYPGQQGAMMNNVYLITLPEGQTIMHTGDQDYKEDIGVQIKRNNIKVDILLVQCWMMPMNKFVSEVNPSLIILGHENEMGHTIDHREAYWLTFRRMSEVKIPYIVMAWGESVEWK